MSQFEKLLGEIADLATEQESMAKALPADDGKDDENIQAAAAEGGSDGDGDADDAGGPADGDADDKGGEKGLTKSFTIKLEDGTEVEAQDGTELVKSLTARIEKSEGDLAKALESTVGLIKAQGVMIKSLTEQVKKLSGEGRGRKTVVSVVEKPVAGNQPLVKSEAPEGLTADQFFAKALSAQKEGRISGTDIAIAETHLNRGEPIPAHIIQRVVQ
jgi:hypothetical protein